MLFHHGILSNMEEHLMVDGVMVPFSLAGEGTKVSLHTFHTLLGLIV